MATLVARRNPCRYFIVHQLRKRQAVCMCAAALLLAPREDADELTRTGGVLGVTVCFLASVDEVLRLEVVCGFRSNCAKIDAVQRIRILYAKNLGRSTLVPSQSHMTYPLSFARPFPRSDIFTQTFNSCQCSCRSLGTSLSLFDQSRFVDPNPGMEIPLGQLTRPPSEHCSTGYGLGKDWTEP